jgi:SAM-dependent MidA family methyltransferase
VQPWVDAWESGLYGPDGFFVRERPLDHFRTSVAVPLFAEAVRRLAGLVDEALGHPDPFDVVDLGAGRGELLAALPDVPSRWRLTSVDLAPGLPSEVPEVHGLLLANEWLDDVPCDVLFDDRVVEVDEAGLESLGATAGPELLAWRERWWPAGRRVEVGLARDRAWAAAVARVSRGLAVAVDYGHDVGHRRPTLTGYRQGTQVPPVPDGDCDLTAHVALDSCAAATGGRVLTQRDALAFLGLSPEPPDRSLATTDPRGYLALLQRSTQAAELMAPRGLGSFGWLCVAVGCDDPLAAVASWSG